MAMTEAEVLKARGISFVQVAEYIGVTRQSVARGIEADTPYLDARRVAEIFAQLQIKKPEEAEAFRADCISELSFLPETFDQVPTSASRDSLMEGRGPTFNAPEIWVFTAKPREIYLSGYLESIASRVYKISDASAVRRMIFFVPSEVCRTLRHGISGALRAIPEKSDRIHIQIIECDAMRFAPHYIILNPRSDEAKGLVAAETEDRFMSLPHNILEYILENIIIHGFSIKGTGPDRKNEMNGLSVFFDSNEDDVND